MGKQETWTPAEYREHLVKSAADEEKNKYKNRPVVIDGHRFQSTKEGKYYGQLKIRKLAGEIVGFEMQVTFSLEVNGVHICDYIADFVLTYPDGRREVIDVKSKATAVIPTYRIKKALMWAIYQIQIIEK